MAWQLKAVPPRERASVKHLNISMLFVAMLSSHSDASAGAETAG